MVAREDELEPFAGEREELVAPSGEERADGHAQVHEDDEGGGKTAENGQRDLDTLILDEHTAAGGLAGQGRGGLALEVILLHRKHRQRDAQQHDRHRRRARLIVGAGDLQINGGGEGIVGAADEHGVGEVGDGLDEGDEEGVAETGEHQRQRDAGEDLPAARAHVARGLLERGVDVLQKTLEHHVAHGEEGERLHDGDAPEAVDAVVVDAEQEAGDDARLAEEHDHGKRQHERRGDDRQHRDDLEKAADKFTDADVDFDIGKEQAEQRREDADEEADLERVGDGLGKGGHGEDALEDAEAEAAVAHEAVHQQDRQRIENEQSQKGDEHDDGGDHDGIGHQLFPVQRRALRTYHRELLSWWFGGKRRRGSGSCRRPVGIVGSMR